MPYTFKTIVLIILIVRIFIVIITIVMNSNPDEVEMMLQVPQDPNLANERGDRPLTEASLGRDLGSRSFV